MNGVKGRMNRANSWITNRSNLPSILLQSSLSTEGKVNMSWESKWGMCDHAGHEREKQE